MNDQTTGQIKVPHRVAGLAVQNHAEPPLTAVRQILVIDDDHIIRDLIAFMLRRAGYGVGCAKDGEGGWDALCASTFDLLITDQDMPGLRGLDLVRRVRKSSHNLPIILISGQVPWDAADFSILLPPGAVMEKPFTMEKLLSNVRIALTPMAEEKSG